MLEAFKHIDEFLIEHHEKISAIESFLRSLTYILPGRFEDAEFASEALYACLNLIGLYHDLIITRRLQTSSQPAPELRTATSQFNRYTRSILKSNDGYKKIAYILTVLQYTEVFFEMAARKFVGDKARWRVILAIEGTKVVLRLLMLRLSSNRMMLATLLPERDHDPSMQAMSRDSAAAPASSWRGNRTGRPHKESSVENIEKLMEGDVTSYIVSKALSAPKRDPLQLVQSLAGERLYGEILFIVRPLIYVMMLRRSDKNSWSPWLVSFVLDAASRFSSYELISKFLFPAKGVPTSQVTQLEDEELRRRLWLFLYYFLRQPVYDLYTRSKLQSLCDKLGKIPVLGIFGGIIREYIPLWEQIYFYTSTS